MLPTHSNHLRVLKLFRLYSRATKSLSLGESHSTEKGVVSVNVQSNWKADVETLVRIGGNRVPVPPVFQ